MILLDVACFLINRNKMYFLQILQFSDFTSPHTANQIVLCSHDIRKHTYVHIIPVAIHIRWQWK